MAEYLVRWDIDIEADSPDEAAQKAREIQLRYNSVATVFDVYSNVGVKLKTVDLEET
jgi:hypothetical protein